MYVYKVTNKLNGKFYYGQHTTSNLDDGYMGSGQMLKMAFKKYGIENFSKKILKFCNSTEELDIVERRLVSPSWLKKHKGAVYNMIPGGYFMGGENHPCFGVPRSEETKRKLSENHVMPADIEAWKAKLRKARVGKRPGLGKHHTDESKKKHSNASKKNWEDPEYREKVMEHLLNPSEEARRKIGEASRRMWENPEIRKRQIEARRNQPPEVRYKQGSGFRGKVWANNGIEEHPFLPEEIPDGWNRGRMKKKEQVA